MAADRSEVLYLMSRVDVSVVAPTDEVVWTLVKLSSLFKAIVQVDDVVQIERNPQLWDCFVQLIDAGPIDLPTLALATFNAPHIMTVLWAGRLALGWMVYTASEGA